MSFKTMDGVEVYDKSDVDDIITPIQQDATEAKQIATTIDSRKLDKSQATQEFAADRERLSNLENNKVDKSEIPGMVNSAIDNVINAKVASITSDINHIVGNAVDAELDDYDDSNTVDQKIATAIDTELDDYDDKAAVNQKISTAVEAAVATRPVAMTTAEATALVNQYF